MENTRARIEIDDIRQALERNELVLFIGAGISIGAGLPGWLALIRPLAQAVGFDLPEDKFITTEHLLSAAQYYENKQGRQNLIQYLRDQLDTTDKEPTPVHQCLASLSINTVFTTNYDDLIEVALRNAGKRRSVIFTKQELPYWKEDQVQVIKLCGDLTASDSIAITKSDFNTYFAERPRLIERLRTTLETKTALFLGYSLQDPFLNQIWDNIGLDFGKHRRVGYAAMFDAQELEVEDLKGRGIHVINLDSGQGTDRTQILESWLRNATSPRAENAAASGNSNSITSLLPSLYEPLHPSIPPPPDVGFVLRRDPEGRDIVERLKEELLRQNNRPIALWGAGGVGKTTLAAEAARGLIETSEKRILWVSAEGRPDFALLTLLDDIVNQLQRADLRKLALELKKEEVRALITAKPTVVVLDNFETITPNEQPACVEFLSHLQNCSALITTRDKINTAHNIPIYALSLDEAREFVDRFINQEARDPQIFAEIDRDHIITTAESNPLVLQWVIAQIDLAGEPQEVLSELARGEGDAAHRVFDRSFDLPQLGDNGRAALMALSLFAPSASRPALAEVAGFGKDERRMHRRAIVPLSSLWLVKGVQRNQRLTVEGLTRELAKAHLLKYKKANEFRRRFVTYFVLYAEANDEYLPGHYNNLEAEKDNLLSAVDIAFEQKEWKRVTRIARAIFRALERRGYWNDAKRRVTQALEAARNLQDESGIADFDRNLAEIYHKQGDFVEARRLCNESLEINNRLGNQTGIAFSLLELANTSLSEGNMTEAKQLYNLSLRISEKSRNQFGVGGAISGLGMIARDEGNFEESEKHFKNSLSISRKLEDMSNTAIDLYQLGVLAQSRGDLTEARRFYDESYDIDRKLGSRASMAITLHQLWLISLAEKDFQKAEELLQQSLSVLRQLQYRSNIPECLESLGRLRIEQKNISEAELLFAESLKMAEALGDQIRIGSVKRWLGILRESQGEKVAAAQLFREALSIFESLGRREAEVARKDLERVEADSQSVE
jgi:tetratricopeptide (TPR) repeat protein